MAQLIRRWIGDNQVDHTKIDPTDVYTIRGLNVTSDATVIGHTKLNGNVTVLGDMTVAGTTTVTHTEVTISEELRINQMSAHPGILIDQTGNAPALQIKNIGGNDAIIIDHGNIVLGTGGLISYDTSVVNNLYVGHDTSIANALYVGNRYQEILNEGDALFGTHGGTGIRIVGDNGSLNRITARYDSENDIVGHLILGGNEGSTSIDLADATITLSAPDFQLYSRIVVNNDASIQNNLFVFNQASINIDKPTEALHVAGTSSIDGVGIALENIYGGNPGKFSITTGPGPYLHFIDEFTSLERMYIDGNLNAVNVVDSLTIPSSDFAASWTIASGPTFNNLHFYDNVSLIERLTISDFGYVGIGTFPYYTLDVAGDGHFTYNLYVDQYASIGNGLGVSGGAYIDILNVFSGMGCSGDAYFYNDASIYSGNLYVNTDASVANSLTVGNRFSEYLNNGDVLFGTHGGTGLRFVGDNGSLNRIQARYDADLDIQGWLILESGGSTSISLAPDNIQISPAVGLNIYGDATVSGNLQVLGNLVYPNNLFQVGSDTGLNISTLNASLYDVFGDTLEWSVLGNILNIRMVIEHIKLHDSYAWFVSADFSASTLRTALEGLFGTYPNLSTDKMNFNVVGSFKRISDNNVITVTGTMILDISAWTLFFASTDPSITTSVDYKYDFNAISLLMY